MNPADEKRIAAKLAKTLTMMCVRNTRLEALHSGKSPVSLAGDYSDVRVIDADGHEIPWNEVSHLDQDEMRALMKEIVNRIYTFNILIDDPEFHDRLDRWTRFANLWDEPEEDKAFLQKLPERD